MSMNAVVAHDVSFHRGTHLALDRSTFTVPRASRTSVIGPNGSGKSTLLAGIAGLRAPSSGRLEVFGGPPTVDRVALVLQSTKLNEAMPVTVREVVGMGRYPSTGWVGRPGQADKHAVSDALRVMELTDLAGRQLTELSGGERQRVYIAQGLAQDHDLLLLDEPHTGLDVVSEAIVEQVITAAVADGRTVIMTTHDLSEAAAADHVLLLSGRVVASGDAADVLTPTYLTEAYGMRGVRIEEGRVYVDDPAHLPVGGRHTHGERVVHPEVPGSDLH